MNSFDILLLLRKKSSGKTRSLESWHVSIEIKWYGIEPISFSPPNQFSLLDTPSFLNLFKVSMILD